MEFGFINEQVTYESLKYFRIVPLDGIQERFEFIKRNYWIKNGWLYPPIEYENDRPTKQFSWYALPNSHSISLKVPADEELYHFVISFFGFLNGMRLVPDQCGHFYKTPFEKEKLIAFLCKNSDTVTAILEKAIEFYINYHKDRIGQKYHALVHWFLMGQCYTYDFERFDAQYKVLDGCFDLHKTLVRINSGKNLKISHSNRLEFLCSEYGLSLPDWGKVDNKTSILSELRNSFVHEVIYAGKPVGYKIAKDNLTFQLIRVNERILLSLLGLHARIFTEGNYRIPYLLDYKV